MSNRFFEAVNVGNFHAQKGSQRVLGNADHDGPRIAYWRNNLTALSHDFDLYFAAHGDQIHVTKPRDLHQTLPIAPDLVLGLPRGPLGSSVSGYIDPYHPHDVNSIKVGKLGDFEILLIACDDGDLLAYYTRLLEREVKDAGSSCSDASTSHTQPFFHENVGISAWGLAIHQVSRLVAVGTNNSDVHVFQPALAVDYDAETGDRYYQEERFSNWRERYSVAATSPYTPVPKMDFGSDALGEFERKDCRLRLELGPSGSNIPSIDFVSDENGEASVVLAADINGKLWSLDLSRCGTLEWPEIHRDPNSDDDEEEGFEPRGWGVLCIPISCFMLVQSRLGGKDDCPFAVRKLVFCCGRDMGGRDLYQRQDSLGGGTSFYDAIDALKYLLQLPITARYRINTWNGLQRAMAGIEDSEKANTEDPELIPTQWASMAKKMQAIPRLQEGQTAVIRTSAHDIELIPPDTNMLSTICRNFLRQDLPRQNTQEFLDRFDRLNMFAVIPELSLLVVASQKGRVSLFTLTRLEDDFCKVGPVVMFRHDHILPLTGHEKESRPLVPLLGMAVGPLQGKGKNGRVQRKIWRLILHYTDHTILSYELKRNEKQGGLEVL
ncbi:hypothetical protein BKA65DRAFT_572822 [Rhexocercosporidium sp. MPI-PUGE-AT-0058]|nr:hypothetical protein BKA65DRAFT_572822 [Rhexocercosporidium sp. MPI-PUGE-AT-0058]